MKSFARFSQKHNLLLLLVFIFILAIIVFYVNKSNYFEGLTAAEKHNSAAVKRRSKARKIMECKDKYYKNEAKKCPNSHNINDELYIDCEGGLQYRLNNMDYNYIDMKYENGKCSS